MSCSWKHLSSAGRIDEEREEEKTLVADDHMSEFKESDIEVINGFQESDNDKEDYVPPSESSTSCDGTASITLTVPNNTGKFIFCLAHCCAYYFTIKLLFPYSFLTNIFLSSHFY
jgi:hypothetical protein